MKLKAAIATTAAGILVSALLSVPACASYGTVNADLLTIRTGPSTSYDAVGYLCFGDQVTITYDCGGWYEIYHGDHCYYICSDYVSNGNTSGSWNSYDEYSIDANAADYYTGYGYDPYTDEVYGYEEYDGSSSSAVTEESQDPYANARYLGNFTLSAYCGCASCCGSAGNLTASGTVPTAGRTVAMGGVDFGTKLLINGTVYTVEDRGTPYGMVDIFMNSHSDAIAFGLQSADVYVIE